MHGSTMWRLRPRALGRKSPVSSWKAWWEGHASDEHRRHGEEPAWPDWPAVMSTWGEGVWSSGRRAVGALTLTRGPCPLCLGREQHVGGGGGGWLEESCLPPPPVEAFTQSSSSIPLTRVAPALGIQAHQITGPSGIASIFSIINASKGWMSQPFRILSKEGSAHPALKIPKALLRHARGPGLGSRRHSVESWPC